MEASLAGVSNNKEANKWMKGLDTRLVKRIAVLEPDDVTFEVEMPKYVRCIIRTKEGLGRGLSICSVRDRHVFDLALGKTIAAGRALCALKEKKHGRPIRTDFDRTWLPSQVKLLEEMHQLFVYKSMYSAIH